MMMALVICLLTEKFKADNKNVNVPTQFCVKSVSENFDAIDCRLVSLKGNVYIFHSIPVLLINLTY